MRLERCFACLVALLLAAAFLYGCSQPESLAPASATPETGLLAQAALESTALVEQAQATAMVLRAQAQATALISAAEATPLYTAPAPTPQQEPAPAAGTPAPTTTPETASPTATPAEEGGSISLIGVGFAADGAYIHVQFYAPPRVARGWQQGQVYVVDESTGTVYNEIPVMPII
ncbi:MAG: hypothetical protein EHM70_26480, partial [Chloroflexota bacterium]